MNHLNYSIDDRASQYYSVVPVASIRRVFFQIDSCRTLAKLPFSLASIHRCTLGATNSFAGSATILSSPGYSRFCVRERTLNQSAALPNLPVCLHMTALIYFTLRLAQHFLPIYTPSAHDEHTPLLALDATSLSLILLGAQLHFLVSKPSPSSNLTTTPLLLAVVVVALMITIRIACERTHRIVYICVGS